MPPLVDWVSDIIYIMIGVIIHLCPMQKINFIIISSLLFSPPLKYRPRSAILQIEPAQQWNCFHDQLSKLEGYIMYITGKNANWVTI